jgi:hypothetical protein
MKKIVLNILLALCIQSDVYAQTHAIPDSAFLKLRNLRFGILYNDSSGKIYGNYNGEKRMDITFYKIDLERSTGRLNLSGRISIGDLKDDTLGIAGVQIFIAKRLDNSSQLFDVNFLNGSIDKGSKQVDIPKNGNFQLSIFITPNTKLFFDPGGYYVMEEFHVGKLLRQQKKYKKRR